MIVGVNSVIALFLRRVGRQGDVDGAGPRRRSTPIKVPVSLGTVLVLTAVATVAIGVYPGIVTRFSTPPASSSAPVECQADTAAP